MPHIASKTVARAIYMFAYNCPPLAFKCESGADSPGVFLPSSMFDRCTTEMSAFSASSPCVSPTSRRKSAMRLPMAEGLQFLFIAFHPFADNTNGDCTSGFVPGNTASVLFHLPCRNIFFCRNPCHCAHLLCKHTQYHENGGKSRENGKVSN